jgi:hypothetical protein
MKQLSLLVLVVLVACKSAQTDNPSLQDCPGGGNCEVQVFKETKLLLEADSEAISEVSFGEDANFQVIFIQYKSTDKKSDYTEEVYLQIPSRFREIHSKNYSLQNQKVVFGKICDCDEKGFELVTKGELKLVNLKEYISLHLEIESKRNQVVKIVDIEI